MADEHVGGAADTGEGGGEPYSPDNRPDSAGALDTGWDVESSSLVKSPAADAGAAAAGAGDQDGEAVGDDGGEGAHGDGRSAAQERADRLRDNRGRFARAGEGQDGAPGADGGEAAGAGKGGAKPSDTEKRIKQLTARVGRFEREATGWRERALALEQELQRTRGGKPAEGAEAAAGAEGREGRREGAGREKKFTFPTWEKYSEQHPEATHEDYMDARDDAREEFKTNLRRQAQAEVSAETEHVETARQYRERLDSYAASHPEYAQLIEEHGESIPNSPVITRIALQSERCGQILHSLAANATLARRFAAVSMPTMAADFIAASPIAESLVMHIAKNPVEFRELLDEGPVRGMRALGELERNLLAARRPGKGPAAGSATKRPSPPIRPIGGSGPAGNGAAGDDLDSMEFGPDWIRADNERERRAGRRRF